MSVAGTAVPYEVLSMIFLLGLNGGDTPQDRRFLVAITAVCPRWRAAALDTPRLWNQIRWESYISYSPFRRAEPDLMRLLAYLERSEPVPLDLSLGEVNVNWNRLSEEERRIYSEASTATYDEAWRQFCEGHAHRCRSLILGWATVDSPLLPLPAHRFQGLELLDVTTPLIIPLFDSPSSAPLKQLIQRGEGFSLTELSHLRTDQIERLDLELEEGGISDAHELIVMCHRLLELSIWFDPTFPLFETEDDTLECDIPTLTHLDVRCIWPSELQEFFNVPNVVSLRFRPKFIWHGPHEPDLPANAWKEIYEGGVKRIGGGNLRMLELSGHRNRGRPRDLDLPFIRLMLERNPIIHRLEIHYWPRAWSILWYLLDRPDPQLVSDHVLFKLLDEEFPDGDDSGSYGNDDSDSDENEVEVDKDEDEEQEQGGPLPADYREARSSHAAVLPELETLVMDTCLLEALGLAFDDVAELLRAVLRARPELEIIVEDGDATGPEAASLVAEFGERVTLGRVDDEADETSGSNSEAKLIVASGE